MVLSLSKTTIEVRRTTLQALEELRNELGAKSLDETIRVIIRKARNAPESRFGAHPDFKPFAVEEEARAHEL